MHQPNEIDTRIAIAKALIAAHFVITGNEMSEIALDVMVEDLMPYGADNVMSALTRCRRECRGRMALVDVLERIESSDGRPSADEAWMNALMANDESSTVVWTEETAMAFAIARPSLEINDKVGARMAFKATYDRLVQDSRESHRPTKWSASLGWDVEQRRLVLESAVQCGRLGADQAIGLLPPPQGDKAVLNAILKLAAVDGQIVNSEVERRESARRNIENLKAILEQKTA